MKVGDWVFWEFELARIKEMEEERITEVTTGYIRADSYDFRDRIFPLSEEVKVISDGVKAASDRIHRQGHAGLNFPDIHRWLAAQWVKLCKGSEKEREALWSALHEFLLMVLENDNGLEERFGVPLLRRRAA